MVAGGMCGCRGGAWLWWGMCGYGEGVHGIRRDTVNEREVRILLECILVLIISFLPTLQFHINPSLLSNARIICSLCYGLMHLPFDHKLLLNKSCNM